MGLVLKLLLASCIFALAYARFFPHLNGCPEGYYKSEDLCYQCVPCATFLYEKAKCTETSNTVCGWCGKQPDDTVSDEVMASYQSKCLMSRLEFVDMKSLGIQFVENMFYGKREKDSSEEKIEVFESGKSNTDYFNMAEESLNQFEDSEEQELPDPTFREELDSDSMEDSSLEQIDDRSVEEMIRVSKEENMGDAISEKVKTYLDREARQKEKLTRVSLKGAVKTVAIPQNEIESSLKHLVDLVPIRKRVLEVEDDSSEDSNERIIKWDKWVDDKVKPIKEEVEIVEAEEIFDDSDGFINYSKFKKELKESEQIRKMHLITVCIRIAMFFGVLLILFVFAYFYIKMRAERKVFEGIPTDAPDYQMIIEASKHIEDQEKKNQFAARHIHDNPVFNI